MKVSVITPTYNSERTLEDTILSVKNQDYDCIEYIIVDGGSSDGTLDIIKRYPDIVVKWISEKDEGISDAFNKGIKLATGDIISIINSDDQLLPHTIKKVVQNIEQDTDVFFGNGKRVYTDGRTRLYKANDNPSSLYQGMTLCHPSVFVRKNAYLKYGLFNTDYKCVMDRELLLRMYRGGAIFQYMDDQLATYSMGGESDKNYFKYVLPEDYRISVRNGMNRVRAQRLRIKNGVVYYLVKIRDRLLNFMGNKENY